MSIPRVFISYSHDTQEHKKWVLDLATRLRNSGIDASLDQWDLKPGADLPVFMEKSLSSSDYNLMICTENYVEKANAGTGGVGYEKMIITSDLLADIDSTKVIPIIRQEGTRNVPTFIKTKLYINFSRNDEYEVAFDELIRTMHNAPLYKKPEIKNNPFDPTGDDKPLKTNDTIFELMKIVVNDYERGKSSTDYYYLNGNLIKSKIMLDLLLSDASDKGLIHRRSREIFITEKGKIYALNHDLIDKEDQK